jgi:uncharacterized tellurite resistance protein B-like protein
MLIDRIRSLFEGKQAAVSPVGQERPNPASSHGVEPVALAACVLLLELAHADGEFSDAERTHLAEVLERQFSLPAESGRALMEEAEKERKASVDHYRFTSRIQKEYDLGQKMVLAEVMWGLVLADGEINEHEQYLTRKISNLLDLKPGYLSAAKAAAEERQGRGPEVNGEQP